MSADASWTESGRRLGLVSAASVALLGVVYLCVGALGVVMRPAGLAALAQVDPYLAILELLIILSAVALVALMAAVHAFAAPAAKASALAALAFTSAFALLTCATHFVSLTVGRQISAEEAPQLARQLAFDWPSVSLALDLLAWELFLGLALLFASPAFVSGKLQSAIRFAMLGGGVLCIVGVAGRLSGIMAFDHAAIFGRAFVVPAVCVMIAVLFRRQRLG